MIHRYLKNVTTLNLIEEKCTGCGVCANVCPHQLFEIRNGKANIIDKDLCIECGACSKNCQFGALTVKPGTGCAQAILKGWITNSEPECYCGGKDGDDDSNCC